jgi:dipeptidyl aminopeptidase/acylaminoacyl peptidase
VGVALLVCGSPAEAQAKRLLRPTDLFAIVQLGESAWSPDGGAVAVQLLRSADRLDWNVPTSDVRILDARTGEWRDAATRRAPYVGFFGAVWSPSGNRLLVLSIDSNAVVRPWIWTRSLGSLRMLNGVQLSDGLADDPAGLWSDENHVIFLARDSTTPNSGPLYAELLARRNVADRWKMAQRGAKAAVTVMESGRPGATGAVRRLVAIDISTGARRVLASGDLHHPSLSANRRILSYHRLNPALAASVDTSWFGNSEREADYLAVDWGNEVHTIDLRTGKETTASTGEALRDSVPAPPPAPRDGARRKAVSPTGDAALYVAASDTDGTRLWLARRAVPARLVWQANSWVRGISAGASQAIAYRGPAGQDLTGWVIYPPGHGPGERLPSVTIVYPGLMHTSQPPSDVAILNRSFDSAQLIAALGYVVILPSIPYPARPMKGDMIAPLLAGVMPMIDTVVARAIVDPRRIALLGQSAGGYSVQAMITQTSRFRTAVSTAGYSNLISLYGTFYGQYRHGDAGDPQMSTVLRMMQLERGYFGAAAPPWGALDRYIANSPLFKVEQVHTPLMIVQGENDFVPVQQSEEYFTGLYRQNKRAQFIRYYGEGHTITRRANVLDFWERLDAWLRETMR